MLEIIKLIIKLIFFSFCQVVFISNVTRRAYGVVGVEGEGTFAKAGCVAGL